MEFILVYLILGCFAGLVGGLLGIGGGIVIVPVLAFLFQAQGLHEANLMHLAIGTSLATIVVTSVSAVVAHQKKGAVEWSVVRWLAPGLIVGALFGAFVADMFSSLTLQRLFGVFEIAVGLYMFLGSMTPKSSASQCCPAEYFTAGSIIGSLSSIMGIGGGTMSVPYLAWRGYVMTHAVATSAAGGFFISLFGGLGYVATGLDTPQLPDAALGYLYWPAFIGISVTSLIFAPLGARLAHRMPVIYLKRFFSLVLVVIGAVMVVRA